MTVNDLLNDKTYSNADSIKVIKLDYENYTFTDRIYELDIDEDVEEFKLIENREAIACSSTIKVCNRTSKFTGDTTKNRFVELTVFINK